jgi:hypothetical protein
MFVARFPHASGHAWMMTVMVVLLLLLLLWHNNVLKPSNTIVFRICLGVTTMHGPRGIIGCFGIRQVMIYVCILGLTNKVLLISVFLFQAGITHW